MIKPDPIPPFNRGRGTPTNAKNGADYAVIPQYNGDDRLERRGR
jgi:hypothetical protein